MISSKTETVWSKELYIRLNKLWKTENKVWAQKRKCYEENEIKKHIEEKEEMIIADQKWMIWSLLDKQSNSIYLDRVVVAENGVEKLINNKEKVKEKDKVKTQSMSSSFDYE